MKVGIEISQDEVVDAVRAWLIERGVPVLAIDAMELHCIANDGYGSIGKVGVGVGSVRAICIKATYDTDHYSIKDKPDDKAV